MLLASCYVRDHPPPFEKYKKLCKPYLKLCMLTSDFPPLFLATLISEELGDFTRKFKKNSNQSNHSIIK